MNQHVKLQQRYAPGTIYLSTGWQNGKNEWVNQDLIIAVVSTYHQLYWINASLLYLCLYSSGDMPVIFLNTSRKALTSE